MEELPRGGVEARLDLAEEVDAATRAGDFMQPRAVDLVREDLTVMVRHARPLTAACGDPVPPKRPAKPPSEAAQPARR